MSACNWGAPDTCNLPEGLAAIPLNALDVSDNRNWSNIAQSCIQMLARLLKGSSLSTLSLSENEFDDPWWAEILAKALPRSNLQVLKLSHIPRFFGASNILKQIDRFPIRELSLEGSDFNDQNLEQLTDKLPVSTLRTVGFSLSMRSSMDRMDQGIIKFATVLSNCSLTDLNLEFSITSIGLHALAQNLPQSRLSYLSVKIAEGVSEVSWDAFIHAVSRSSINRLSLEGNLVQYKESRSFSQLIKISRLQQLNLEGSILSLEQFAAIGAALPHTALKYLGLSTTQLSDQAAWPIIQALPKVNLSGLDLGNNQLTNQSATRLAKALVQYYSAPIHSWLKGLLPTHQSILDAESKTNLSSLNLYKNSLGRTGVKALCEILPATQLTISDIDLGGNVPGDASYACQLSATQLTPTSLLIVSALALQIEVIPLAVVPLVLIHVFNSLKMTSKTPLPALDLCDNTPHHSTALVVIEKPANNTSLTCWAGLTTDQQFSLFCWMTVDSQAPSTAAIGFRPLKENMNFIKLQQQISQILSLLGAGVFSGIIAFHIAAFSDLLKKMKFSEVARNLLTFGAQLLLMFCFYSTITDYIPFLFSLMSTIALSKMECSKATIKVGSTAALVGGSLLTSSNSFFGELAKNAACSAGHYLGTKAEGIMARRIGFQSQKTA